MNQRAKRDRVWQNQNDALECVVHNQALRWNAWCIIKR